MKTLHTVMALLAGLFCLGYDIWLIRNGLFHPATIVPLLAWMALVVWSCRRPARS